MSLSFRMVYTASDETLVFILFRKFAVTKENSLLLFHAPGRTKEFNPFVLQRTFFGAYDETVSIDWSTDSKYVKLYH